MSVRDLDTNTGKVGAGRDVDNLVLEIDVDFGAVRNLNVSYSGVRKESERKERARTAEVERRASVGTKLDVVECHGARVVVLLNKDEKS